MKTDVTLLSKNPGKIAAASRVFSRYGIRVTGVDMEFPEIQADTSAEIARHTALEAYRTLQTPVVREDHSFFLGDTGVPGPYMAYFDKRIKAEQLLSLLQTFNILDGHFELAAAFVDDEGELHEFRYEVPVVFENTMRGDEAQNWERLIRFPDDDRVFAEYAAEERGEVWEGNFIQIAELITSRRA